MRCTVVLVGRIHMVDSLLQAFANNKQDILYVFGAGICMSPAQKARRPRNRVRFSNIRHEFLKSLL